jgi:hypothetical protein
MQPNNGYENETNKKNKTPDGWEIENFADGESKHLQFQSITWVIIYIDF